MACGFPTGAGTRPLKFGCNILQHFLSPATKVGKLLFPDAATIRTKDSDAYLRCMLEFNGFRDEVRAALGLGEDPTTGVKAPTGIPTPPLYQVRNYEQYLALLRSGLGDVPFLDLRELMSRDEFYDIIHTTPKGAAKLTERVNGFVQTSRRR